MNASGKINFSIKWTSYEIFTFDTGSFAYGIFGYGSNTRNLD